MLLRQSSLSLITTGKEYWNYMIVIVEQESRKESRGGGGGTPQSISIESKL